MVSRPPDLGNGTFRGMNQAPSTRGKARSFMFAAAVVTALGVAAACVPSPRGNGDACLKDQDCLSGICADALCRAAPTLLDAEATADGSLADGATGEAGPGDAAADAPAPSDSGTKEAAVADSGRPMGDGSADTGATDSGSADSAAE